MTMSEMNPKVDVYLRAGCGRCPLGNTPDCKVNNWRAELEKLRAVVLDCGLKEELKWGVPCYTFEGSNILLLGAFKESCALSFLNGALLKDKAGILSKPGANSQAGRVIRFTDEREIARLEPVLKAYIREAVEAEKAGLKVSYKKTSEYAVPAEFQNKLDATPELKKAFEALTPGRQRAYLLYFAQPKQSKTRAARIEKCVPQILTGRGLHDYRS